MSWTSNGFFRNVTILKSLTASNAGQDVTLYQPGILNPNSVQSGVRYSGFITTLRAHIDVKSLVESAFPVREPGMSDGEFNAALRVMDAATAKMLLDISLKTDNTPEFTLIGSIPIYNRRPYYTVDLLLYLTDATAYDCASDCVISVKARSAGFGNLTGADIISINGSAIEEVENSAPSLNINVFGSGGSPAGGNVVTDESGNPVTTESGDVITT